MELLASASTSSVPVTSNDFALIGGLLFQVATARPYPPMANPLASNYLKMGPRLGRRVLSPRPRALLPTIRCQVAAACRSDQGR